MKACAWYAPRERLNRTGDNTASGSSRHRAQHIEEQSTGELEVSGQDQEGEHVRSQDRRHCAHRSGRDRAGVSRDHVHEAGEGPRGRAAHGHEGKQGDDSLATSRGRRCARRGRRAAARQRQGHTPLTLASPTHATRLRGLDSRVAARGGFTPMLCTNTSSPPSQPANPSKTRPLTDTTTNPPPAPPIQRSQKLTPKIATASRLATMW